MHVWLLPGWEGRVCRGRGLSRGSLPVRNTGEMGAGPVSSDWVFCGTPGWGRVTLSRKSKDKQHGVVSVCLCFSVFWWWFFSTSHSSCSVVLCFTSILKTTLQLIYDQWLYLTCFNYYTQHVVLSSFCICIFWILYISRGKTTFAVCAYRQRKKEKENVSLNIHFM